MLQAFLYNVDHSVTSKQTSIKKEFDSCGSTRAENGASLLQKITGIYV